MNVIELRAENFKRLKAIAIRAEGRALQIVEGKNAAGKTSVLDAIAAALGGKALSPERPIRDGEKSAEVSVDLGDLIVTRRWRGDKSELQVMSKDGGSHRSPQAMLDKLVGDLSFDPLRFLSMKAPEQAQLLRTIAGIDTTNLDGLRRTAYDARTAANRVLKTEQTKLEAMPLSAEGLPDKLASISELVEQQQVQIRHNEANANKRRELTRREEAVKTASEALARARATLDAAVAARDELSADQNTWVDYDLSQLTKQIKSAETMNERVREMRARAAQVTVVKHAHDEAQKHEQAIADLDARKAKLLEQAKFPVPGLSVDGDMPTLNGLPLAQASGAEKLRASLAVSAALNPKLKVALVRDGSLLDTTGLALVEAWAEETGMQVWIERVADAGTGMGVLIEDGAVVEQEPVQFPVGGAA